MTELCKENDTDGVGRHDDDDDDGDDDDAIDDGDLDPHLREKTKNQPCDSVADACQQNVQLISFAGQSKLMIGRMRKSNRQNLQISFEFMVDNQVIKARH